MSTLLCNPRPRWPDVVIVIAILALAAVGTVVLFGDTLNGWIEEPDSAAIAPEAPAFEKDIL